MTDRFDEMARGLLDSTFARPWLVKEVAHTLRAQYRAGQEAMRERAAQVCDGCRYADTAAADIRSLPLKEPQP